ncbi:MAG: hypothetical protein K6A36_00500 [Paludibacteraceae bacterium]|nr:hypothetical protein [Paludibacteraceae bacterium]
MNEIIEYIITWLCYGDRTAAARVAYSADRQALRTHDVIIIPNGHLGQDLVLPDLSEPIVEQPSEGKFIIRTDIVYSTFFFISRAEELVNDKRDKHGRFLAKYSVLGQKNQLLTPLLDVYARTLMKCLGLTFPENGFDHIYLTHDIDAITQFRHLRGALGGILRGKWRQVKTACNCVNDDPLYTFPWMIKQDAQVPQAQTIYFVKHTRGRGYDYPQYNLKGRDFLRLKNMLRVSGARLGLHSSYYGQIRTTKYHLHRSHYLRCSIEQMQHLVDAGITDDFTMGFADHAGFRLQTTRAVRWINPITYRLTTLTLHPLSVMDTTLSAKNYMNLSEADATTLCSQLMETVKIYHGDLCLLWHNSNFMPDSYHISLYPKVLEILSREKVYDK